MATPTADDARAELDRRIARVVARQATHPGANPRKLRWIAELVDRDGWICQYCAERLVLAPAQPALTIDHVVPKVAGGQGKLVANMAPACQPCNRSKADQLPVGRWRPAGDLTRFVITGRPEVVEAVRRDWFPYLSDYARRL